jgi:hypothetical protein
MDHRTAFLQPPARAGRKQITEKEMRTNNNNNNTENKDNNNK